MMRVREFIYGISTSEYVGAQQASDMEVEVQSLIQSLRSLIFVLILILLILDFLGTRLVFGWETLSVLSEIYLLKQFMS